MARARATRTRNSAVLAGVAMVSAAVAQAAIQSFEQLRVTPTRASLADVAGELAELKQALAGELSRRDRIIKGTEVVDGRVVIARKLEFTENSELIFVPPEGAETQPIFVFADTIIVKDPYQPGTIGVRAPDPIATPQFVEPAPNGRNGLKPGENGEAGADGEDGASGIDGTDGPRIFLVARVVKTPGLRVDVRGVDGGEGGQGQDAGDGGPGAGGHDAGQSAFRCRRYPGDGGNGGDGGYGGAGGNGGKGGHGGTLSLIVPNSGPLLTPQGARFSLVALTQYAASPSAPLVVLTQPGQGGAAGGGGALGLPGKGAPAGREQLPFCPGSGKHGVPGKQGGYGAAGTPGEGGRPATVRVVEITPQAFDLEFGQDTSDVWWWPF